MIIIINYFNFIPSHISNFSYLSPRLFDTSIEGMAGYDNYLNKFQSYEILIYIHLLHRE